MVAPCGASASALSRIFDIGDGRARFVADARYKPIFQVIRFFEGRDVTMTTTKPVILQRGDRDSGILQRAVFAPIEDRALPGLASPDLFTPIAALQHHAHTCSRHTGHQR